MASPRQPDSRRDTRGLPRARGTTRLDSYAYPAETPSAASESLSQEALGQVIMEAEALLVTLRPRFGALGRALATLTAEASSLDDLFTGVSEGERVFTMQLAQVLGDNPDAVRMTQIAQQQYQQAEHELAMARDPQKASGLSASKFRGTLYPLYNMGVTFTGIPTLERLFPRPRSQAETRPLSKSEPDPKQGFDSGQLTDQAAELLKHAATWLRHVYGTLTSR